MFLDKKVSIRILRVIIFSYETCRKFLFFFIKYVFGQKSINKNSSGHHFFFLVHASSVSQNHFFLFLLLFFKIIKNFRTHFNFVVRDALIHRENNTMYFLQCHCLLSRMNPLERLKRFLNWFFPGKFFFVSTAPPA